MPELSKCNVGMSLLGINTMKISNVTAKHLYEASRNLAILVALCASSTVFAAKDVPPPGGPYATCTSDCAPSCCHGTDCQYEFPLCKTCLSKCKKYPH